MADPKKKTSVSLSQDGRTLLEKLARKLGVSQSAVLEIAIREKADREGVALAEG